MKLSICIPVYNFDVRPLVYELNKQIKANTIDAEIILIDDASNEAFKEINSELKLSVNQFIFLKENVGRSKIRNLFADYSTGDYLLFLDCDGRIINSSFLEKYISFLEDNNNISVIYGGRSVQENPPSTNNLLRWKYAQERENPTVEERKKQPYITFQTNNFIIKKDVFLKTFFSPEYSKYGYEDVWFALDLEENNVPISHIQNPILNDDLEANSVYLKKIEEATENLLEMLLKEPKKAEKIKLVKAFQYSKKTKIDFVFLWFFKRYKNKIVQKLSSGKASLYYLDIYKLGLMLEKEK